MAHTYIQKTQIFKQIKKPKQKITATTTKHVKKKSIRGTLPQQLWNGPSPRHIVINGIHRRYQTQQQQQAGKQKYKKQQASNCQPQGLTS